MNDLAPSQKLEQLISALKLPGDAHAALLATKLIDTLSLACAGQGGVYHLASFLTACGNVKWDALSFDLCAHLLANETPGVTNTTYLQALGVFLNVLAEDPEYATEATFNEILQSLAEPETPASAPEIFQPQMLSRVFDSKVVSDADLRELNARFVLYRHLYSADKTSHQLRGLAFENMRDHLSIILESGEFVEVPKDYPHLASLNVSDGHVVPTTLLAYVFWLTKDLADNALMPADSAVLIAQGKLGLPTTTNATAKSIADAAVLAKQTIDNSSAVRNTARDASTPARISIGERAVLLHAVLGATGTQIFSAVADAKTEQVLMRLDYPRSFSVRGIYLFPLPENSVFLTVL